MFKTGSYFENRCDLLVAQKRATNIHNHLYIECRDALIKIYPKLGRLTEFRKVELDNPIVNLTYDRPPKHCLVGNLQDTEQKRSPLQIARVVLLEP